MSGESCSECDGYGVVIVDGEEVHCATCSLRAEVERLRADLAAERALADQLAEWLLRIVPDEDRYLNDPLMKWEARNA